MVSIEGLDKVDLTYDLWKNSKIALFYIHNFVAPPTLKKNELLCSQSYHKWYFDSLKGRDMKCDLSGDMVDVTMYDRDNGPGAFRTVVDNLRERTLIQSVAKARLGSIQMLL